MTGRRDQEKAWNDYWASCRGGCLPAATPALNQHFTDRWSTFAASLPAAARVLDLATGDGVVMRWLKAARADLDLVGVDLAGALPPAPPGTRVMGGVAMESLPFADSSFDAIVSQFGFEYGDIPRVADEASRVLRSGGMIALLTHSADGPLVAHNRRRAESLAWILARPPLSQASGEPFAQDVSAFRAAASRLRGEADARFGRKSPAWEIGESICRHLDRQPVRAVDIGRLVDELRKRASGELARLSSLDAAAKAVADPAGFARIMKSAGFRQADRRAIVHAPGHEAMAYLSIFELD